MHRRPLLVISLFAVTVALLADNLASSAAVTSHVATPKPTYTIAFDGPLSGASGQLGMNMEDAAELAIQQADNGATFGPLPFDVQFSAVDDAGSSTKTAGVIRDLISAPQVVAVVGPVSSSAVMATEPLFAAANLVTVSPSATGPSLALRHWQTFFRVVSDDAEQATADASYVAHIDKAHAVAMITGPGEYAAGIAQTFDASARADKVMVVETQVHGTQRCGMGSGAASSFAGTAAKVRAQRVAVVFYAGYYCDFALLARALRANGYTGTLMSDDGSLDPGFVRDAGQPVAEGALVSCACLDPSDFAPARSFDTAFEHLAGFPAGSYSAEAYVATNAIIGAMHSLGTAISRSALLAAVRHVRYVGMFGVVRFRSDGDIERNSIYLDQVRAGKFVQLGSIRSLT